MADLVRGAVLAPVLHSRPAALIREVGVRSNGVKESKKGLGLV